MIFQKTVIKNKGYCPTCETNTTFLSKNEWLRDHYICIKCKSIPRERALMLTIKKHMPHWEQCIIHESSSIPRGASALIAKKCQNYISTQYIPETIPGSLYNNIQCEDLENLSFKDESIDLHITQDVLEHLFSPKKAFSEIARTLKPWGMHIFTVPIINKHTHTTIRAHKNSDNTINYCEPPIYHANPVNNQGSLVTYDWGYDICHTIYDSSRMITHNVFIDDLYHGVRAEYIDVFVSVKIPT